MNKSIIIRLASAGLMITAGGTLYIISRKEIIFFEWVPQSILNSLGSIALSDSSTVGYFIIYCLPDGLWYGALLILQSVFADKSYLSKFIFWISIILPFIWEISQISDNVPGTFDPMDICMYLITLLLFIAYTKQTS